MEISQIKNKLQLANVALTNGLLDESIKLFYEILVIQSTDADIFGDLTFLLTKIVSFKFNLNLNISDFHTALYYNTPNEKYITVANVEHSLSDFKKETNLDNWVSKIKLFKVINYIETFDFDKWIDDYLSFDRISTMEKENELKTLGIKLYSKNSIVNFGKFKTFSIEEILLKDPGLLIWYHDNLTHFYLMWDVILDINFIKILEENYFEFLKRFISKTIIRNRLIQIELLFIEAHEGREEQLKAQEENNKRLANDGFWAAYEFDSSNIWNTD